MSVYGNQIREGAIDEIMDSFDFGKVHKAMKALDWKWYFSKDVYEIPDLRQLRKEARRLLLRAVKDGGASTGGFVAKRIRRASAPDDLELSFVVSSWDSSEE